MQRGEIDRGRGEVGTLGKRRAIKFGGIEPSPAPFEFAPEAIAHLRRRRTCLDTRRGGQLNARERYAYVASRGVKLEHAQQLRRDLADASRCIQDMGQCEVGGGRLRAEPDGKTRENLGRLVIVLGVGALREANQNFDAVRRLLQGAFQQTLGRIELAGDQRKLAQPPQRARVLRALFQDGAEGVFGVGIAPGSQLRPRPRDLLLNLVGHAAPAGRSIPR